MIQNDYAPIVIFVYRRKIIKLLESLRKNKYAKESRLIIFSDGNKDNTDFDDVNEVRNSLKNIDGFRSIEIVEAKCNKGLANSIITGVTEVVTKYKKIIVLEDDLIVSNNFLEYMNEALSYYNNNSKIWSISGYSARLPCLKKYKKDLYLSVRSSSWGWGTWFDRWQTIDWNSKAFISIKKDRKLKRSFELGGNDMYLMLELQMLKKIDSWAIRWCFSQFLQNKYTVFPAESKVINNGFSDDKGTHNSGLSKQWDTDLNNHQIRFEKIEVDTNLIACFKQYHDISLKTRFGYLLRKYGGYQFIKKINKYFLIINKKEDQ